MAQGIVLVRCPECGDLIYHNATKNGEYPFCCRCNLAFPIEEEIRRAVVKKCPYCEVRHYFSAALTEACIEFGCPRTRVDVDGKRSRGYVDLIWNPRKDRYEELRDAIKR